LLLSFKNKQIFVFKSDIELVHRQHDVEHSQPDLAVLPRQRLEFVVALLGAEGEHLLGRSVGQEDTGNITAFYGFCFSVPFFCFQQNFSGAVDELDEALVGVFGMKNGSFLYFFK